MSIVTTVVDILRFRRTRAFLKRPFGIFLLTGAVSAAANVVARIFLNRFMSYELAVVLAYLLGVTVAFGLSRRYVFAPGDSAMHHQYLRYGLVNLLSLVIVWIVSVGLARVVFPEIGFNWHPDTVAHVIGVISPVFFTYFSHKHFSFR
jgi:putative flippase GtrA